MFLRSVILTADKAKDNYNTQPVMPTESEVTTTQKKRKGDEQGKISYVLFIYFVYYQPNEKDLCSF